MTHTDNSIRGEVIALILALVFVFLFLATAGYVALSWMDEGPSVHWVPPSYNNHHK